MPEFRELSDKVSLGYYPVYRELAAWLPESACILEIGVARGGGILMWQWLLPLATVVGVDSDPDACWPPGSVRVVAGQADADLADRVRPHSPDGGFDVIVDDASHHGSLSEQTFRLLWPLVRPGGLYVLEDWTVGLPDSPYFGTYGGDSMVRLAQSFVPMLRPAMDVTDMGDRSIPAGGPETAEEVRYRYGLAILRKQNRKDGHDNPARDH